MAETASNEAAEAGAVAVYKRIFKEVLDSRPSGMRLRLANAIGKNRSFVSQISNPTYPVPIPVQHLNTIFEVCHFPPQAKTAFLRAYARAHPRRVGRLADGPHDRALTLHLPDLGSAKKEPSRASWVVKEPTQNLTQSYPVCHRSQWSTAVG